MTTTPEPRDRRDDWPSEMRRPEGAEEPSMGGAAPVSRGHTGIDRLTQDDLCGMLPTEIVTYIDVLADERDALLAGFARLTAELTAERSRNAPLRARIKALQDQHDQDTAGLRSRLARETELGAAWHRNAHRNYERWKAERERADAAVAEAGELRAIVEKHLELKLAAIRNLTYNMPAETAEKYLNAPHIQVLRAILARPIGERGAAPLAENTELRAALEQAAAFWRPVAADLEHGTLSIESVRFLAQDFLAMVQRALATGVAAGEGETRG